MKRFAIALATFATLHAHAQPIDWDQRLTEAGYPAIGVPTVPTVPTEMRSQPVDPDAEYEHAADLIDKRVQQQMHKLYN